MSIKVVVVTLLVLVRAASGFAPPGSFFSQTTTTTTRQQQQQQQRRLPHQQHALRASRPRDPVVEDDDVPSPVSSRRMALVTALTTITALSSSAAPAQAYYDKNYPQELESDEEGSLQDGRARRKTQVMAQEAERTAVVTLGPLYKPASAAIWGAALWLLAGSRSNPVATPLANVLYNAEQEKWLQDRNDGLFAALPLPMLFVLALVFCAFGFGADTLIVALADGDRNISLQLAGVSLISGASLELGRIASGEKAPTRDEADRDGQLIEEFEEFAQNRLVAGGNCHRNDVVRAFRRYFAKYRQADSEEYPLTDLEIERLLKRWTKTTSPNEVETTSSGFIYGLSINKDADVFV